jgi:flavin-dependent dehydrogenase
MERHDVVILGGGLSGLTLARQLVIERPGTSVLVLEGGTHPVPEAAHKVGESSVEIAGTYFRDVLGLGDHLDAEHLPKLGLRYFFPQGDNGDIRARMEMGPLRNKVPVPFRGLLIPSFQLDRGRLENHLAEEAGDAFRHGCRVTDIALSEDGDHVVTYERDGAVAQVAARWVIDAAGRPGMLKKQLDLALPIRHRCNAVWFRVQGEVHVDDWVPAGDPWHDRIGAPIRWHSTVHLMGVGYWVWLIPLASGATSIGIVAHPDHHAWKDLLGLGRARQWLRTHEPQLAQHLDALPEAAFLDFKALREYTENARAIFSADRWGLTGDAGCFVDPFYSPGSDFIAIANTQHTDLIVRDLEGEDICQRAERANHFFKLLYEQFVRVYAGQYRSMGNPQVMAAKIVFDNAFYWGWVTLLFLNKRLCDPAFMDSFADEVERSVSLQGKVEEFFASWDAREVPDVPPGVFIDQFDVKLLWQIYVTLIRPVDGDVLKRRLSENLDKLEAFAELVFRRAADGVPGVRDALRIDPHVMAFEPDAAVFDGPDRRKLLGRIRPGLEPLWVDGRPGPTLPPAG